MKKHIIMLLVTAIAAVAVTPAHAESSSGQDSALHAVLPVANPCPRLAAGSIVQNPPSLFSQHGVLTANFSYQTTTDTDVRTLFCFMTPDGLEMEVGPGMIFEVQPGHDAWVIGNEAATGVDWSGLGDYAKKS